MATQVDFGICFEINGQVVSVEPTKALKDAKKNGVDFRLPQRVDLGTTANIINLIGKEFGQEVSLPKKNDLPDPLGEVVEKLEDVDLAVEKFHIRIPGTDSVDKNKGKQFTVGLSAKWSDGHEISLLEGFLKIRGLYLTVSNEESSPAPSASETTPT